METLGNRELGIEGRSAPELQVDRWMNLADAAEEPAIEALRGKVVYLYFFQSWCPGCHSHGFPALRAVYVRYADHDDVALLAVQTTFEGHSTNTAAKALEAVKDHGLEVPVGHAEGEGESTPSLMLAYRTGGTPWTVIIDRQGLVRFNGFSIDPSSAADAVEELLTEPAQEQAGRST